MKKKFENNKINQNSAPSYHLHHKAVLLLCIFVIFAGCNYNPWDFSENRVEKKQGNENNQKVPVAAKGKKEFVTAKKALPVSMYSTPPHEDRGVCGFCHDLGKKQITVLSMRKSVK